MVADPKPDAPNPSRVASNANLNRTRPKISKEFGQIVAIQADLFNRLQDDKLKPFDRLKLIEAFDRLSERRRIMKQKPMPGTLKHQEKTVKTASNLILLSSESKEKEKPAASQS